MSRNLRELFLKHGGMDLLKQYAGNGALLTAGCEFILLGRSRTALEILRYSAELKTKERLERQYREILLAFDREWTGDLTHRQSEQVWSCWLQGTEHAPEVVQKCLESIRTRLTDRKVIVITAENMDQYIRFPEYIMEKWKKGIITNTHLSDLIRLELLIRYGGMWVDATVFCSEDREKIPDYFFDSDLFFYQNLKPGRDGHPVYLSSWLISAKSNNRILMAVRKLCYEYWKRNSKLADYYLFHIFFSIVLDHYPGEWNNVVPQNNAAPQIVLSRLFDPFDRRIWEAACSQTPFHKLSYKNDENQRAKTGTFYRFLTEI